MVGKERLFLANLNLLETSLKFGRRFEPPLMEWKALNNKLKGIGTQTFPN